MRTFYLIAWCVLLLPSPSGAQSFQQRLTEANDLMAKDPKQAEPELRRLLAIAPGPAEEAHVLDFLGNVHQYENNSDSVLYYKQMAYDRAVASGRPELVDTVRMWLSYHLLRTGHHEAVIDTLLLAVPGLRQMGDLNSLVAVYGLLGSAYRRVGLREKAANYARRGYETAERGGDTRSLHIAARRWAFDLQQRMELDSAVAIAEVGVRTANELGGRMYRIPAYGLRSSIRQWQKEYDLALQDITIVEEMEGDHPNLATLFTSANLHKATGRQTIAKARYHQAIQAAQRMNNLTAEENAYWGLTTAHLSGADYDTTYHYQQLWQGLRDSLRSDRAQQTTLELQERYEAAERDAEIATQKASLTRQRYTLYGLAGLAILATGAGVIFYLLGTRLRRSNREKDTLVAQKEALIGEVHHRVKNNLQVISSLLSLQSRSLESDHAVAALQESQTRVEAMGMIHERLYGDNGPVSINMRDYLTDLGNRLLDAYRLDDRVELYTEIEDVELDVDTAIPLALIVNELITNSIKYAFPADQPGTIEICLHRDGPGDFRLEVSDDGVGATQTQKNRSPRGGLRQSVNRYADRAARRAIGPSLNERLPNGAVLRR